MKFGLFVERGAGGALDTSGSDGLRLAATGYDARIVTATPRPTEHLTVDVEDPRTLSNADRAANSEEKVR